MKKRGREKEKRGEEKKERKKEGTKEDKKEKEILRIGFMMNVGKELKKKTGLIKEGNIDGMSPVVGRASNNGTFLTKSQKGKGKNLSEGLGRLEQG